MNLRCLHNRSELETCFRTDPHLNVYQLGDLDPRYFDHCVWYAGQEDDQTAVALGYMGFGTLVLILPLRRCTPFHLRFIETLAPLLPQVFYVHIHPELTTVLDRYRRREWTHRYRRMGLVYTDMLPDTGFSEVVPVGTENARTVEMFLGKVFPETQFDRRILETGHCKGMFDGTEMIAFGGMHTYSADLKVAALGNIVVDPAYRGKGLCRQVTGALCRSLSGVVDTIGLNVLESNEPARRCYQSLGFADICLFDEILYYL